VAQKIIDVRSLARAHTECCIKKLSGFVNAVEGVPPSVQVQAAAILLERGWGRPASPVTGEDGEGPIQVAIIRRARVDPKP
jgi:hypothetical protein